MPPPMDWTRPDAHSAWGHLLCQSEPCPRPSTARRTGATYTSAYAVDAIRQCPWYASGSRRRREDNVRSGNRRSRTRWSNERWRCCWQRSTSRPLMIVRMAFGQVAAPTRHGMHSASAACRRGLAGSWMPMSGDTLIVFPMTGWWSISRWTKPSSSSG